MSKKFILNRANRQPNGYVNYFIEQFSTLEEARKSMSEWKRIYLPAGKSLDGFVVVKENDLLTIESPDKKEKIIIEIIPVEPKIKTLFVLFKNDTNEEEFERHIFTDIEDAKNYIKEIAEEYKDLFNAEIRNASYDGNVKSIDGGDYGHGYIDGKYNLSDLTLHFEIRKPSQKNVVDIVVEEVQF